MKKTLLVALAVLGLGVASSKAGVAFGVSFGHHYRPQPCAPVYRAPVCVTPAPVYVAPAPVYRPVYPVYHQPVYAPVCPTPVVVQPRYYGGYGHHGYSRHHSGYNPGYGHRSHGHHGNHGSVRISW